MNPAANYLYFSLPVLFLLAHEKVALASDNNVLFNDYYHIITVFLNARNTAISRHSILT